MMLMLMEKPHDVLMNRFWAFISRLLLSAVGPFLAIALALLAAFIGQIGNHTFSSFAEFKYLFPIVIVLFLLGFNLAAKRSKHAAVSIDYILIGLVLTVCGWFFLLEAIFSSEAIENYNSIHRWPAIMALPAGLSLIWRRGRALRWGVWVAGFLLGLAIPSFLFVFFHPPFGLFLALIKSKYLTYDIAIPTNLAMFSMYLALLSIVISFMRSKHAVEAWTTGFIAPEKGMEIIYGSLVVGMLLSLAYNIYSVSYLFTGNAREAARRAEAQFGPSKNVFVARIDRIEKEGEEAVGALMYVYDDNTADRYQLFWTK